MKEKRIYFCIDMKAFFASVECAERGYNPFEVNLVVADKTRGRGALCLAVSPKMKSLGVKNRCRLFETPKDIEYEIAKPRMSKYIEYTADIYEIYLNYISKDDIHVYSIDESFIDATDYLKLYNLSPKQFASKLMNEIADKKHIPSTVGIGTNLYLAKVALDITAKSAKDHIGYLDEELYRKTLWRHEPLTDFWQIGRGIANRLKRYDITNMKGIAEAPKELMYKIFGINAELLIDHAWGKESCTMEDIKNYKNKSRSISNSQILLEDYTFEKAAIVINEMALSGCQEMMKQRLITNHVGIGVGYSKDLIPPTGGNVRMSQTTNVFSIISKYVKDLFERTTARNVPIRRLAIWFNNLCDEGCEGYDLFTNFELVEKEKRVEQAALEIKKKFGKNAMLRGMDLQEGATAIIRNKQIGGHNSE
jgi:DNA polymerase V